MVANALTIAGSDSGGGAGIQADLKTFSALGVYGASVITAVTAQNTLGVRAVHAVPVDVVAAQLDAVFEDIRIDAVKIGMLASAALVEAVATALERHRPAHVVLDPVMVAKSGDRLLADDAVAALLDRLMPLSTVITPNLPEAAALLGRTSVLDEAEMPTAAEALRARGAPAVLIKGGHLGGDRLVDLLDDGRGAPSRLTASRISTENTHGTGCSLSSAIAARLAQGDDLRRATAAAHGWLQAAIAAADALEVGGGHGPVHHFHALWKA